MAAPAALDSAQSALGAQKFKVTRSLRLFHSVFFILAGMIALETLGQVAYFGAETLTWIIVLAILFVVPYGLVVSELGAAYPYEGGPYPWMREAWGRKVAGLGAVLYWIATPIWVGGSLCFAAAAAWSNYIVHTASGSATDWLFKLVFIWLTVLAAVISLQKARWIPTLGAITRIGALGIFSVSLILYGIQNGLNGVSAGDYIPANWAALFGLAPILLFSFQGFELPSTAAEEMIDPEKTVPKAVSISAVVVALAYCIPVFGIITVLPRGQITGVSGFLEAVSTTFSVFGPAAGTLSKLAALGFIIGLVTTGGTWLMGVDRTYAVSAIDGAAPAFFGKFSDRFGTPVRVNLTSGLIATGLLIVAQFLTEGASANAFALVLYLATSAGILSYLLILSSALRLRYVDPDRRRPYRVPFGNAGMAVASALCLFWVGLGTWTGLFPGLLEKLFGYDYSIQDYFGVSRIEFESFTLGTLAVMLLAAVLSVWFAVRSQSGLERRDTVFLPALSVPSTSTAPTTDINLPTRTRD